MLNKNVCWEKSRRREWSEMRRMWEKELFNLWKKLLAGEICLYDLMNFPYRFINWWSELVHISRFKREKKFRLKVGFVIPQSSIAKNSGFYPSVYVSEAQRHAFEIIINSRVYTRHLWLSPLCHKWISRISAVLRFILLYLCEGESRFWGINVRK